MGKVLGFRIFLLLLFGAMSLPAEAQPVGQWDIDVGGGRSSRVTMRSLPNTANSSITDVWVQDVNLDSADLRSQTVLDMRGELVGKVWRGTWHWFGNTVRPAVAVNCRIPHRPAGHAADQATTVWGQFEVTFNFDMSRFSGTWYPNCGVRSMRANGVPVSGMRRQRDEHTRTTAVTNGERNEGQSDDNYLPVKPGHYRTTWGPAIVRIDAAAGELVIAFAGHSNVNYTISAGRWSGAGAGTGRRPAARGRYFLALFGDVQNWDPPANSPPRCTTRFPLGNRDRWDIGALDAPRWGRVDLYFSRSGNSFQAVFDPCRSDSVISDTTNWPNNQRISGIYERPFEGSDPVDTVIRSERLAAPSLPARSGPCHSITAMAMATLEPCRLAPTARLQIRLTKPLPSGVRRIYLKPLVDDRNRITAAVRGGLSWPAHPSTPDISAIVGAGTMTRVGDVFSMKLPSAACARDYWEVVIQDGTGQLHYHNGVVSMECGPGAPMPGW